jgi:hypothetical protein
MKYTIIWKNINDIHNNFILNKNYHAFIITFISLGYNKRFNIIYTSFGKILNKNILIL